MDGYLTVEIGLCRMVMNIYGIWPKDKNFAVYLRFAISLSMMIGFCNIPQTVKLIKVKDNFYDVLEIITTCNLTVITTVIKNGIFWSNHKGWLLDSMARDWNTAKTEKERRIMQKNAKFGRLATVLVLGSFATSVTSFVIVKFYASYMESVLFKQGKINATQRARPMYLPAEFPYDHQQTPYYEIIWIFQVLTTCVSAGTYAIIDGFFSSVVLHLCAQMQNLRGQLKNVLIEAAQQKGDYKALNLSEIMKRHTFLMGFAQTIEDVFNVQFLVQLVASIVMFCLNGYQIVEIVTTHPISVLNLIFGIYYYICHIASLFVYCLIATVLSIESTKMRETAYNSEWYELSPSDARLLILIMIRTQEPFELTAGKFVALSLELYCSVLKTSGGYISMLMAMKDRLAEN